jgi:hypothetical protein
LPEEFYAEYDLWVDTWQKNAWLLTCKVT